MPSDSTGGWLPSNRRTVLKAVGLGGVVSALGASASGLLTQEEPPTGTVHTVQMRIGPPSNENRPADFFYQPTGLQVDTGDVVRWVAAMPDHNVVSYHPQFGMNRRVPTGVDAFASPILGWTADSIADDAVEPPAEPGPEEPPAGNGTVTASPTATPTPTESPTGNATGSPPPAAGEAAPEPQTWLHSFDEPGVYDLLCSPHEVFGMAMRVVVGDVTEAPFETEDSEALAEPRAGPVGLARVTLTDPALAPDVIAEQGSVAWTDLVANGGEPPTDTDGETDTGTDEETGTDTAV